MPGAHEIGKEFKHIGLIYGLIMYRRIQNYAFRNASRPRLRLKPPNTSCAL